MASDSETDEEAPPSGVKPKRRTSTQRMSPDSTVRAQDKRGGATIKQEFASIQ